MIKNISKETPLDKVATENNCIEANCRLNIPKKSLKTFSVTFDKAIKITRFNKKKLKNK
jgi:hypothetical protein